ncbi:MAG: hypothetical protein DRI33_02330, partial [Caldiserica bacterium]
MKIIFFDGVREIGGNKIIIEDNGTSILFDFGKRFSINNIYFNDSFVGRSWKGIHDRIVTKELPPLRNFYKESPISSKNSIDIDIEAVFFSHAHLDHIGLIDLIDDSLEKYMSNYSKEVLSFFGKKGIIKNNVSNIKIIDKPVKVGPFTVHPIPI